MSEVINLESFDYAYIDNIEDVKHLDNSIQLNHEIIDLLNNVISNVLLIITILLVQHINLNLLALVRLEDQIISFKIVIILVNFITIPLSIGALSVYYSYGSFANAYFRYKHLRKLLHRSRIMIFLIYFILSVPISINYEYIIRYTLGLSDNFQEGKMFIQLYIHAIFIYINFILNLKYIHILGYHNYSILLCCTYIIISTGISYYFICIKEYGLLGVGYSLLLSTSIMILISLYFMNKLSCININIYKVNKGVFQNPYFLNYIRISIGSGLISLLEYLFFMLIVRENTKENSFFSKEYVIIDYLYIVKSVANGACLSLTNTISFSLGKKNYVNIKKIMITFVKVLLVVCSILCTFNLMILYKINLDENCSDPEVLLILKIYTFYIFIEFGNSNMMAIFRSINNQNMHSLFPLVVIYILMKSVNLIYQIKYKSMFYIYIALMSFMFMFNFISILNIDWKKEFLAIKSYIHEEKLLEIVKFNNYIN